MQTLRFRPAFLITVLFLSLFIIAGCSDDDSPSGPQGSAPEITSFTASPSTVPAGGDSVTLSWQVTGADSLTISPGVGKVTPATSGSIKVFVASATVFTLKATNDAGSKEATTAVTAAQAITVSGFVKDLDGEPISGVTVIVKGKSPTITSGNGGFTVQNVSSPYEIRLILSTQQSVLVYQGLTKNNPVLIFPGSTTISKSAVISGTVPPAAGKTTRVFFVSGTKSWYATANQATGEYSISVSWKGSTDSHTGKVQVLRWTANPNGLPSTYDAYGSKDLTVSAGGTFSGKNFVTTDLTDPAEQNISGNITRPSTNYAITVKYLYLNFGYAYVYIASEAGAGLTDNFSYSVPVISGATFEVDAYSEIPASPTSRHSRYWKMGITGGASGVNIALASAPQLNLPAHNGTAIDTTTQFLWAQGGSTGINEIAIIPNVAGPKFYIYTAGNSTTIPNLGPQGLGLPTNTSYYWLVSRIFPVNSVDDAASDTFIPLKNGNGGETGLTQSEVFQFNTK